MTDQSLLAHKYKFFAVGALGTFMSTFDGSILNVALPTISDYFHAPVDTVAWVILSYSLTLIALMMIFGAWTESRGYAFAYRFGYIFFGVGSIICALSPTVYALIFGRVVQATGSAMFAAIGPGMVTTVFPPNERGKGIGMMVMMVAAGFMVGPPVGGFMLAVLPWHFIFLINIPIGIVGLYLVNRYFKALPRPDHGRKVRIPGAVAISVTLVAGIFALSLVDDYSFASPLVWGSALLSGVGLIAVTRIEADPAKALIGLDIFRNRQFTTSILAQQAHFISTSGVFVLIPFYLERVKGLEPQAVGGFLVILPTLMFILSPLAGRLSDKIGYRLLTTLGMLVTSAGLYMLSQLEVATPLGYFAASIVVIGFGIGIFSTPNSSALMGSVSPSQRGVTSGILATSRNIGMSIGIGLSAATYSFLESRNAAITDPRQLFIASYRPVILFAVALSAIGIVFTLMRGNRTPA